MTILEPNDSSLKLDHSSKETAHNCLRKYFLNHLLSLQSDAGSTALRYGSVWHATQEAFYNHIKENGWTRDGNALTVAIAAAQKSWDEETRKKFLWYDDYRTLSNLTTSFLHYLDEFAGDENHLVPISVEQHFKIPMVITPAISKLFPYLKPFWFTGITDMEIYYDGRYWQLDHKTTGQSLSTQANRLQRSAQSIGYSYAGRETFKEIPDGHMITLAHLSATKSKVTGEYGKPRIGFKRIPMVYTNEDLESWKLGFLEHAQRIQIAISNNSFPCDDDSCYTYGRCTYTDICDMNLSEKQIRDRLENQGFEGYHIGEKWDPAANL